MSFKEVDEILKIIDQFPVAEVRFEHGDLKLYVRRDHGERAASSEASSGGGSSMQGDESAPSTTATAAATPAVASTPAPAPTPAAPRKSLAAAEREGLIAVSAPMMGVFYSAPSPEAPPFVTKGKKVVEGDDLCIIEVMKVMNLIKAPCAGIIEDIEASNMAMVEQSQALMWIRPAGKRRG